MKRRLWNQHCNCGECKECERASGEDFSDDAPDEEPEQEEDNLESQTN